MKTNVFKKAHEITKKIIKKEDSYRETFRLALIFVYSEIKKGAVKIIELKGTEKQVKWANDIRNTIVETMKKSIKELTFLQDNRGREKRIKRYDRLSNELSQEIEDINNLSDAKTIIETYKNIYRKTVDVFMNVSVSKLK